MRYLLCFSPEHHAPVMKFLGHSHVAFLNYSGQHCPSFFYLFYLFSKHVLQQFVLSCQHFGLTLSLKRVLLTMCLTSSLNGMTSSLLSSIHLPWAAAEVYILPALGFSFLLLLNLYLYFHSGQFLNFLLMGLKPQR